MNKKNEDSNIDNVRDDSSERLKLSIHIKKHIKMYNENWDIKDLSEVLGVDYELFRKKLTKQDKKRITNRDCIIAIGVVLQMSTAQINKSLRLNDMHVFNPKDMRDRIIMSHIDTAYDNKNNPLSGNKKYTLTLKQLNDYLIEKECGELIIQNKRNKNTKKISKDKLPYRILKIAVQSPETYERYIGDIYDSLGTMYSPYDYTCYGDCLLEDKKTHQQIHLSASTSGNLSSEIINKSIIPQSYKSLDDTGKFKPYFIKLINEIDIERHGLLEVLKDTKNYKIRCSARVINDSLCVFAEEFNYRIPELNEYFVLTRTNALFELSVYKESAFMQYYLSSDKYTDFFQHDPAIAKEKYTSIEQIELLIKKAEKLSVEYMRLQLRKSVFKKLQQNVDELFKNISEGKAFILNQENIYQYPRDLISHYRIEEDFKCKYDEQYGWIEYSENEKEYISDDGQTVIISIDDLCDAFNLGLENIRDIVRIKAKYGEIKNLIK